MSYTNRTLIALIIAAASVALYMYAPVQRSASYSTYISVMSLACLYMNIRYSVRGLWSASSVFILIFWCFHFGVILANAAGINVADVASTDFFWQWMDSPLYTKAEALALSGIAAFTLVTVFRSNAYTDVEDEDILDSRYFKPLQGLAYIMVIGGIGGWLYIMLSMGGVSALFAGYGFYLRFIENYPIISMIYWGIGVGAALLGIVKDWYKIRFALILFILWGLVAFSIGLRGEVLYSGAAFLVTYSRQVRLPQGIKLLIAPILLLSVISFIRVYRVDGTVSKESFNPIGGLVELGGSLQTVVIAEEWINSGTDHFHYGETILAPLDRMLDKVILADRISADKDMRLMNVAMGERNGPYGFSPIAEGYMNMGIAGGMILMMLISSVLNYFDTRQVDVISDAFFGGLTFIFFTFIRNSFAHIPGQALLLAITITITYGIFREK